MAVAGHLLAAAVPAGELVVDVQRGQRERHQGGDPVARGAARAGSRGPTSSTVPTSIPPEPVTGLCILPAGPDDLEHLGPDGVPVAAVLVGQLPEAGGVEVEPLDAHAHLVGRERGIGVEPPGGLRQHAGGLEDAVQARPGDEVRVVVMVDEGRATNPPVAGSAGEESPVHWLTVTEMLHAPVRRPPMSAQPYRYRRVELVEPDWTRLPGWRDVTDEQWAARSGSAPTASRTSRSCAR